MKLEKKISLHALCMISERLYFFILSSLYFAGQLLYNGLDPVVGLARCVFGRRHRAIFHIQLSGSGLLS